MAEQNNKQINSGLENQDTTNQVNINLDLSFNEQTAIKKCQ